MKLSIITLIALLNISTNLFANVSGVELKVDTSFNHKMTSNYVNEKSCETLRVKIGRKYNNTYFQNVFNGNTNGVPQLDRIVSELKDPNGDYLPAKEQIKVIKLALCQNRIDDIVFNLIQTKISEDDLQDQSISLPEQVSVPSMTIESYLTKKIEVQKNSSRKNFKTNPFPLSKFQVSANGSKNITVTERLYALYTPAQIKKMSQSMQLVLNVMDAVKVETTVIFRDDSERENLIIEHTPSDIYRLAVRMFNMEKKKLIQEFKKQNLPFLNLDILAAALEMGVVSENEISILTTDDSFYKKDKSFMSKMKTYVVNLGMTAAQIMPATAPYAIVGMILYNSYQEINNGQDPIEYENFYFN
jgi:hypothetical protein